jgi:hypothetical protein
MQKAPECGQPLCRARYLTTKEFRGLSVEEWDQGFQVRLGLRAGELFRELYPGKTLRWARSHGHRNKVRLYPCGLLEKAYRELKLEDAAQVGAHSSPKLLVVNINTEPTMPAEAVELPTGASVAHDR